MLQRIELEEQRSSDDISDTTFSEGGMVMIG
jgi:hypothetical protein